MYPLILFIIAILASTLHLLLSKKKTTFRRIVEIALLYIIPLTIGVGALIAFVGHVFFGPMVAAQIGWPAHNPFQFEVGIGNLAMSVAGFFCIWQRRGFWMATTLFSGVFLLGAAYGHLVQIAGGDTSPLNTGIFLYVGDVGIPLIYLGLTLIYCIQNRFFMCKCDSKKSRS